MSQVSFSFFFKRSSVCKNNCKPHTTLSFAQMTLIKKFITVKCVIITFVDMWVHTYCFFFLNCCERLTALMLLFICLSSIFCLFLLVFNLPKTQFLIQECVSLISKPNFISTLCYAIDNPLHYQKVRSTLVQAELSHHQQLHMSGIRSTY